MLYSPKAIKLKDGRTAVLRAPKQEDAAEMLAYLRTACAETEFLACYPEEYDSFTVEGKATYLNNIVESTSKLMIVSEVGGKIAGNCQIVFMTSKKTLHRAELCIALLNEYCSLGIGTVMFAEMEQAARGRSIRQLELEVISGNAPAMGLYRKAGFTEVGARPDAFRFRDGTYHDEIYMRKVLI